MHRTLDDYITMRENNFDFLRFFAASLVIISHAYPLSSQEGELLLRISGQWDFGGVAVAIFFMISGFLVTRSYDSSNNLYTFIKNRVLRIFPGLIVAVIFCAFVVGPIVTTLPLSAYFSNPETYRYLQVIYLFPMQWTLPGVFESSSLNNSVNGSLWTIPFEVLSYVVVAILGVFGLLKVKRKEIILFVLLASIYVKKYLIGFVPKDISWIYLPSFFELFPFFAAGMFFYVYRDKISLNKWYAAISLALIAVSTKYGGLVDIFTIFGAYLVFYFVYNRKIKFSKFGKFGDFSYGIYIYAFPVQQSVTFFLGDKASVGYNILISFPITLLLAYLSWHLIEKQALKLKNVRFTLRQKDEILSEETAVEKHSW